MRWAHALLVATALLAAPANAELDLDRAEVSHLSNGLTVIILEDHSFPLISVQMLYKSGSAAETTGKTGLAHFMEHLAFRGSKNFPNELATELIYDAGGEWHGYTAYDQTTYFSTMPKGGLDLLLKIEADRMARTVIDPAAIEAEKGAVITEIHSYENDPTSVLSDAVTRTAIQAHPYGSPMVGYVSDVEHLTAEDARAYYAGHYAPGNAVLAIVGDIVPSEARAMVQRDFADDPARPVAQSAFTAEPPQRGERRTQLSGPVDRQYFLIAFPSPAASNPDFASFLVLQEILSGGGGLNLHQSDWSGTPAANGSLLFGMTDDLASFLPPTRDPFLFTISGSIPTNADRGALERRIEARIAKLDSAFAGARLKEAKASVVREIADDVQTTEDAAHQLAFFEGVGALDALLSMPQRIRAVTAADVRRVARTYLRGENATIGWMIPGQVPVTRPGEANPRMAMDRLGAAPSPRPAGEPELRYLSSGLPAIFQANPLSNSATVELLLSAPVQGGTHPSEFPGLDAVVSGGAAANLKTLIEQSVIASRRSRTRVEAPSQDPATRLEQIIVTQVDRRQSSAPKTLAVFVSGNVDRRNVFEMLEEQLGRTPAGRFERAASQAWGPTQARRIRERLAKPLSQGALGYVVEGPPLGTREALAWRLLLYVLTHDYSGRLGRTAIARKGIVYYISSEIRTDGARTWATISIGVDPDKADVMEAELKGQLAGLASEPPSAAELDAARNHILGRDLSAAQSNDEITAKLARGFVETGAIQTHDALRAELMNITTADLASAARAFAKGTIIRIDVGDLRHPVANSPKRK